MNLKKRHAHICTQRKRYQRRQLQTSKGQDATTKTFIMYHSWVRTISQNIYGVRSPSKPGSKARLGFRSTLQVDKVADVGPRCKGTKWLGNHER